MSHDPSLEALEPDSLTGALRREGSDTPFDDATWYVAESVDDSLVYDVPKGALAAFSHLTFDLLLRGERLAKFQLRLHEANDGRTFRLTYGALHEAQARVRLPLEASNQNQWKYDREGAWLKPLAEGDRVDLDRVDRIEVAVLRKSDRPVRWCQSPLTATTGAPPRLEEPVLPAGPLVDEFGQSTVHDWEDKTDSERALVERLQAQRERTAETSLPKGFADWGGWTGREFEATGFFDVTHDGDRWWLVTPDGHPFWSTGANCVRPSPTARYEGLESALAWLPDEDGPFADAVSEREAGGRTVNYLETNLRRAFGDEWYDEWAAVALSKLRRVGFNTVANWSDWTVASELGVPYVRPLSLEYPGVPLIYRDFPDVFHEDFADAAAAFAEQLTDTVEDPAMIGYFLGNEPTWGFADEPLAAGMLYTTETCATRLELADWLETSYGTDTTVAEAWEMDVTLGDVRDGQWTEPLTDAARDDLEDFSAVMVDRLYETLTEACRDVDPNHLNLGTRYAYVPGDWALEGLSHVDVFSINCYRERVPDEYAEIADLVDAPLLIGEWHFGALDVGLPASGIRRVPDQTARGDAYRVYLEDAASKPWLVGAHYFTLYDQSVLGRFDGENYNIGFLDVCHREYDPLTTAARRSHERVYELATGHADPYADEPSYRSQLF